jgi:hypothetical protein
VQGHVHGQWHWRNAHRFSPEHGGSDGHFHAQREIPFIKNSGGVIFFAPDILQDRLGLRRAFLKFAASIALVLASLLAVLRWAHEAQPNLESAHEREKFLCGVPHDGSRLLQFEIVCGKLS